MRKTRRRARDEFGLAQLRSRCIHCPAHSSKSMLGRGKNIPYKRSRREPWKLFSKDILEKVVTFLFWIDSKKRKGLTKSAIREPKQIQKLVLGERESFRKFVDHK